MTNDDTHIAIHESNDAHSLCDIQRNEIAHFENVIAFMTYDDAIYEHETLINANDDIALIM